METKKQKYYREAERLYFKAASLFTLVDDCLETTEEASKVMGELIEKAAKNIGELKDHLED